jgi:peroxiredoxin
MNMKKLWLSTTVAVVSLLCIALTTCGNKSMGGNTGALKVGDKVEDFSLKDYNDIEHTLSQFKEKKAIVVMFISTECPASNAYNGRMAEIADEYAQKDVQFLGINANKQESVEDIAKHSKDKRFNFPVLKDWNNVIADKFGACVTPEVYLLSPDLTLLYHGRIDDHGKVQKVTSHDLRTALDEFLAGKEISRKETKAFGCTIKRVSKS